MKFKVTPELSKLLRMMRMQNNVSAKDLALSINKSPSYVSKLESGDMKSIRKDDLTDILTYNSGGGDFYESVLPGAVKILNTFIEPEKIVNQLWLMQYDVIERTVMIPAGMVKDILAHLEEGGITVPELVKVMDSNFDTGLSSSFLPNELVPINYDGRTRLLIHVDFKQDEVEGVLLQQKPEAGYYCMYNIVHSMFRMLHFRDVQEKLPPDSALSLLRLTATYMEQWGVRSLIDFGQMVSSDEFISNQLPLAQAGVTVIDKINELFREIADHDALLAARQLNAFCDTLNWDAAFIMRVLEIPFSDLGDISYQNKKQLLAEIRQLVEKYDAMSDFEKKLESY